MILLRADVAPLADPGEGRPTAALGGFPSFADTLATAWVAPIADVRRVRTLCPSMDQQMVILENGIGRHGLTEAAISSSSRASRRLGSQT